VKPCADDTREPTADDACNGEHPTRLHKRYDDSDDEKQPQGPEDRDLKRFYRIVH
jgi:hypothetical protein